MKKIFCYLTVLVISLWAFNSCKKMDSTYKQFIVPGWIVYAGKANSPMAYAGRNRVKISWLRGADPNIAKARIFWNNYADSLEINIPATGDTISAIIDNLSEKPYSFMIRTYDVKGASSIPVEILGVSYGELYQNQISNRFVKSSFIDSTGKFSIQWGTADISTGAIATEVKYTNAAGIIQIQRFNITDSESKILDYMPGTNYQYRTLYIPKVLSIDTFYTSFIEYNKYFNINKNVWKVITFSSQNDATATNAVTNFIDGNEATRWYTLGTTSRYPHFATIDMGSERAITQFGVWITTYTMPAGDTRAPDRIQFLVSKDNISWTDLGIFDLNRFIIGEQLFNMPSRPTARYFKFVGVSGPNTYMIIGEISAYEL